MPINSITTEWLVGILGWASFIIVGFGVYYLVKAIGFGAAAGPSTSLSDLGEKLKGWRKGGSERRKLKRAWKKEYRMEKKIVNKLEELKKAIISKDVKKIKNVLDKLKKLEDNLSNYEQFTDSLANKLGQVTDKTI